MAAADGFLWVVGSHGLKRKNAKPDKDHAENANGWRRWRSTAIAVCWLACRSSSTPAASPAWCGKPRMADGRCASKATLQTNLLTRALADDPHFGPYMAIPGKDNGLDIEGLAVDGHRLLLGLRGPVLRGWSALLEIAVEAHGDRPAPGAPGGQRHAASSDISQASIRGNFSELRCGSHRGAGVGREPALYEAGFVSAAHSAEDIAATVQAASEALRA